MSAFQHPCGNTPPDTFVSGLALVGKAHHNSQSIKTKTIYQVYIFHVEKGSRYCIHMYDINVGDIYLAEVLAVLEFLADIHYLNNMLPILILTLGFETLSACLEY